MSTKDNPNGLWHSYGVEVRELVTAGVPDGPTSISGLVATCRDAETAHQIAKGHNRRPRSDRTAGNARALGDECRYEPV